MQCSCQVVVRLLTGTPTLQVASQEGQSLQIEGVPLGRELLTGHVGKAQAYTQQHKWVVLRIVLQELHILPCSASKNTTYISILVCLFLNKSGSFSLDYNTNKIEVGRYASKHGTFGLGRF